MDWLTTLASIQPSLDFVGNAMPDADLFGLSGFVSKLTKALVAAILAFLRALAQSVLVMFLTMLEPLTFQTPAVAQPISDVDNVIVVDMLIDPDEGVIPTFQGITLRVSTMLLSIGVLVSFIMLGIGFIPRLGDLAKGNLARLIPAGVMAYFVPMLAQLIVEVGQVATNMIYDMSDYEALLEDLYPSLTVPNGAMDEFGLLVGMLVADIALLMIVLELAARLGIIIFMACIAPLVVFSHAFHFTKGFASKATKFFISAVFLQFFVAIGITIMMKSMVAFQDNPSTNGIPAWAILSGIAALIAYFPRVLSGASEAIGAAMAPAKTALMATAAVGAIGAAAYMKAGSKAAGGLARAGAGAFRDSPSRGGQLLHRKLSQGAGALQHLDRVNAPRLARSGSRQLKRMSLDAAGLGGLTRHGYDDVSMGRVQVPRPPRNARPGAGQGGSPPGNSAATANPGRTAGASASSRPAPTSGRPLGEPSATDHPKGARAVTPDVWDTRAYRLGARAASAVRRNNTAEKRLRQTRTGGATYQQARGEAGNNILATTASLQALEGTAANLHSSGDRFDRHVAKDLQGRVDAARSAGGSAVQAVNAVRHNVTPKGMARSHASHRQAMRQDAERRVRSSPAYQEAVENWRQQHDGQEPGDEQRQALLDQFVEGDEAFQAQTGVLDQALEETASARGLSFEAKGGALDRTYEVQGQAVIPSAATVQGRQDALRLAARGAQPRLVDSVKDMRHHRSEAQQRSHQNLQREFQEHFSRAGSSLQEFQDAAQAAVNGQGEETVKQTESVLRGMGMADQAIRNARGLKAEHRERGLKGYADADPERRMAIGRAILADEAERQTHQLLASQPGLSRDEARKQVQETGAARKGAEPVLAVLDGLDRAAGMEWVNENLVQTRGRPEPVGQGDVGAAVGNSVAAFERLQHAASAQSSVERQVQRSDKAALDSESLLDQARQWARSRARGQPVPEPILSAIGQQALPSERPH